MTFSDYLAPCLCYKATCAFHELQLVNTDKEPDRSYKVIIFLLIEFLAWVFYIYTVEIEPRVIIRPGFSVLKVDLNYANF